MKTSFVAGANTRSINFGRYAMVALLALLMCVDAMAQSTTGTTATGATFGDTAWDAVKGMWFGKPGLLLGALVFALAVYFYFRDGVLAVLGVLAIGTFFFFVPAFALGLQNLARAF